MMNNMTKRNFGLKLFSENDTALAAAIHLCERFVTPESLDNSVDFLAIKRRELNEEVDRESVEAVFPGYLAKHEPEQHGHWIKFWCPARGLRYACSCCAVSEGERLSECPNCGAIMDQPEVEE